MDCAKTVKEYAKNGKCHPRYASFGGCETTFAHMPSQVRHSDIEPIIEILKNLNSKETFDLKSYNKATEWLYSYRFYLTQEECTVINDINKNVESSPGKSASTSIWIVSEDPEPNEDMNSSYYLHEN